MVTILDSHDSSFVDPLMVLTHHESGMATAPESLKEWCELVSDHIKRIVATTLTEAANDKMSDGEGIVPQAFLERNELSWRGRLRREAIGASYERLEEAVRELKLAVQSDFPEKANIVQDINNNMFALKGSKPKKEGGGDDYYHPKDRNNKTLMNRFTTTRVESALGAYLYANKLCEDECTLVLKELARFITELGHLPAIVQAAHGNLILLFATNHGANSKTKGWHLAKMVNDDDEKHTNAATFVGLWPYWMDKTMSKQNTFDLDLMILLTAPNMSGKSTLMRSSAAAALLAR